jgi:hypothetical protein
LVPAVRKHQPDGDGRHHRSDTERHAASAPAGQEKRTTRYAEEQTSHRAAERR